MNYIKYIKNKTQKPIIPNIICDDGLYKIMN